jgi:hypothetical protein
MGPLRKCTLGKDHERKNLGKTQTLKTFNDILIDHEINQKHGAEEVTTEEHKSEFNSSD